MNALPPNPSRNRAASRARFYLVGRSCMLGNSASCVLAPIVGRGSVTIRFAPANAASRQRWADAGIWEWELGCLDNDLNPIGGDERDVLPSNVSADAAQWLEVTITPPPDARYISIALTSAKDDGVMIDVSQVDPQPVVPGWFAKHVVALQLVDIAEVLRKFLEHNAAPVEPGPSGACAERALATWTAIRDIAPPAMRQSLSDSLLELLAPNMLSRTTRRGRGFRASWITHGT